MEQCLLLVEQATTFLPVRQKVYLILLVFAGKHPHVFETKWPSLQRFEEERACHTFLRGGLLGGVVANGALFFATSLQV